MKKIIVQIKGGLGNQLFCYAAARRMALINDAELVIDNVTGFKMDFQYKRKYELNNFQIQARIATSVERMEPFGRYRRGFAKWIARKKPFFKRNYIEQKRPDFDKRLICFPVKGAIYLDGYWQSEGYFKDIGAVIRKDLQIVPPQDSKNQRMVEQIKGSNSVCIHIRWFSKTDNSGHNVAQDYYLRAVKLIQENVKNPHFFIFSDDTDTSRQLLDLSKEKVTYVRHNHSCAFADIWLMHYCKHFVIANSTFSWWGAWLGELESKIVIAPNKKIEGVGAWGFSGLLPERWLLV